MASASEFTLLCREEAAEGSDRQVSKVELWHNVTFKQRWISFLESLWEGLAKHLALVGKALLQSLSDQDLLTGNLQR